MYSRNIRKELADKVKYAYFYVGDGDATLAYVKDEGFESLFFGVAICAPQDNFCRATGRQIARARLFESAGTNSVTLNCPDPKKEAMVLSLERSRPQWINVEKEHIPHIVEYRPSKSQRKRSGTA